MATHAAKRAELHRMVMENHTCPYGLKALDLLKRGGYEVDDHHLTTRAETDAFKAKHNVQSTPQTFIGGKRIGDAALCAAYAIAKVPPVWAFCDGSMPIFPSKPATSTPLETRV